MDVLLIMSIFWIGYGILGIFGIQIIPAKYKGHSWTKDYIRKQGVTWLIVGVPWLAFYLVRTLHVPDADLKTGIEVLILIALSLPALITTIIWEKKYKALLATETDIGKDGTPNKGGAFMKKALRWLATVLAVCIVTLALNLLTDGVPLLGTPKVENIDRVVVTHTDYPDDVKDITDEFYIELAEAMLGYLHYAPLKGLTDDTPVIQITYIMDDGTEVVVKANEKTVWWNGKAHAIHDEGQFVKMCTAVFYLQNG